MGYKPDVYVVVNVVRKNKLGADYCFTGTKSSIVRGSESPKYTEKLKICTVGNDKIIFNVMSSHLMGGDTILGQVITLYSKFLLFLILAV